MERRRQTPGDALPEPLYYLAMATVAADVIRLDLWAGTTHWQCYYHPLEPVDDL